MNKKTPFLLYPLIFAALSLSGCSADVKETLGLDKESPDEFVVMTRAPLEMPPGLALPPPNAGAPRPQEKAANTQAKEAIFGDKQSIASTSSSAESSLLQKAGGEDIDPNIRATVNNETAELHNRNLPITEKLLNMTGRDNRSSATVVDAKKELERIQKNKEEGKNITDGETPIIEQ